MQQTYRSLISPSTKHHISVYTYSPCRVRVARSLLMHERCSAGDEVISRLVCSAGTWKACRMHPHQVSHVILNCCCANCQHQALILESTPLLQHALISPSIPSSCCMRRAARSAAAFAADAACALTVRAVRRCCISRHAACAVSSCWLHVSIWWMQATLLYENMANMHWQSNKVYWVKARGETIMCALRVKGDSCAHGERDP